MSNTRAPSQVQAFHPLADLFPLIEDEEFDELVADVRAHGVREPIWTHQGKVLDGRNRYLAAQAAGVECPTRAYDGDDPVGFVISLNLKRRHLDTSQRAMVAAKLATLQQGARTDLSPIGERSQATAAKFLNVGKRSVERAKIVCDQGSPELIKAVEAGKVSVSAAVDSIRPRPPSAASRSKPPSPAGKALKLTRHDVFGWLISATIEERQRLFDGAGSRMIAESIPPRWDMKLAPTGESIGAHLHARIAALQTEVRERDHAIRELQRQLGANPDAGLDIPPFLRREAA